MNIKGVQKAMLFFGSVISKRQVDPVSPDLSKILPINHQMIKPTQSHLGKASNRRTMNFTLNCHQSAKVTKICLRMSNSK